MHRGGNNGMDRGSRSGGSAGQNGYRRDRDYPSNGHRNGYDSGYADHGANGNNGYDASSKYEQEAPRDRGGGRGGGGGGGRGGGKDQVPAPNGQSKNDDMLPQALIESLEKQITSAHSSMNQALQDISGKENEKFDLIFGILIELQRRQAQLEDSVRSLKASLPAPTGMGQQQQSAPQGQSQPAQGQAQSPSSGGQQQNAASASQFGPGGGNRSPSGNVQNFVPQGNQMGNQMSNQMNGQMSSQGGSQGQMSNQSNGQMGNMGYMQGQMNMGQQYGNMVAPDGSQVLVTNMPANVVLVASPTGMQGMQQMPQGMMQMGQMSPQGMQYGMPQMMSPTNGMQPQMAMQFVGQDQPANNFQWTASDGTQQTSEASRAAGAQPGSNDTSPTQEAPSEDLPAESNPAFNGDGQKAADAEENEKAELRIEEE